MSPSFASSSPSLFNLQSVNDTMHQYDIEIVSFRSKIETMTWIEILNFGAE